VTFGREALRRLREEQANPTPPRHSASLECVPPDAPMDDATITVWNGERFVAYEKWLATAPIVREAMPEDKAAIPADAECVVGECGGVKIWLVKDGQRWLMYAGARKAGGRRRDFASPFLAHAIRTAEQWYGAPRGWRAEKGRDGSAGTSETADLSPQDPDDGEEAGK